jgi:hypothetical protein
MSETGTKRKTGNKFLDMKIDRGYSRHDTSNTELIFKHTNNNRK